MPKAYVSSEVSLFPLGVNPGGFASSALEPNSAGFILFFRFRFTSQLNSFSIQFTLEGSQF